MAILSGQQLACIKQDRILFENINFQLNKSDIFHVKGVNGAGKTTLLRILVGLAVPAQGEVQYQQQNIANSAAFKTDLVFLGHKTGLSGSLSATENLSYWCQQQAINIEQAMLYELLAKLGLVGLEELPVKYLSAGQQRRVSLARLWLKTTAKLWVLDEPFTALDVVAIKNMQQKLLEFAKSGGVIVLTSHQDLNLDYAVRELHLEYQI